MSRTVPCPHCSYEIASFTEIVEALEGGAKCLLCGGELPREVLEETADAWSDAEVRDEGATRAHDEKDLRDEEEWNETGPDFGDEGEEFEDLP